MARPSKYEKEVKPHLEEIKQAVEAGATVAEIADAFGISESSIYKYKNEYKEFNEIFTRARTKIVFQIKAALLKKALGYEYTEERKTGREDKDGEKIVNIEQIKKHMPPSETAAAMLLRNYDKTWIDKDKTQSDLSKQEFELKKAIADSNNFFD